MVKFKRMDSLVEYGAFSGIVIAAAIVPFEIYSYVRFPADMKHHHLFMPFYAIVMIVASAWLGGKVAKIADQEYDGALSAGCVALLYSILMSLGRMFNFMLYPHDCVVPGVKMYVECPHPSLGGWFSLWGSLWVSQAWFLVPSVLVVLGLYRLFKIIRQQS